MVIVYGSEATAMLCSLLLRQSYSIKYLRTVMIPMRMYGSQQVSIWMRMQTDMITVSTPQFVMEQKHQQLYATTTNGSDCNDNNAEIWRSATFYVDADSDGYDNGSETVCCEATTPVGYATQLQMVQIVTMQMLKYMAYRQFLCRY